MEPPDGDFRSPGNNPVDQVTLRDGESVPLTLSLSTSLTLSLTAPPPPLHSLCGITGKNDYKPPEFDPVHQIGLQYGGRRHISARP